MRAHNARDTRVSDFLVAPGYWWRVKGEGWRVEGGKRRVPDEAAKQVVLPKMRATFFHERPTFFHEQPAQKRPRAWDVF